MDNLQPIPDSRENELAQLRIENESLRTQLEDSQETLRAIREGTVDALVIDTPNGQRVFTLEGEEHLYRALIEQMREGAAALSSEGVIHYCNKGFAEMLKLPLESVIGEQIENFIAEEYLDRLKKMLANGDGREELNLITGDDREIPAHVSMISLKAEGPAAVCLVISDLTELKQYEQEILQFNKDLEKKVAARTVQLSMANRELTNEISQREKAEYLLRQNEKHLNDILNSIKDGFFELDHDWNFIYINEKAARNIGMEPEELIGKTLWDEFPGIVGTPHELSYKNAMFGREVQHFEMEGILTKGWYSITVYPSSEGVSVFWQDVTKRKDAEESLAESEKRFRYLVRFAPAGIYEVDFIDGHFTEVNEEMCRILGYTREELLAVSHMDILDDNGKALIKERIGKAQSGENLDDTIEYKMRAKDGHFVWALVNASYHRDKDRIVSATVVVHDITQRKIMEKKLQENEEKYRLLVESSNSIILKTNKDMNITFMNDFGIKFFGYSLEEIIGKPSLGNIVPCKDSEGNDLSYMSVDLRKNPEKYKTNVHENIRKDGSLVWVSWTNKPIYDDDGNIIEFLSIGNDISELKAAEKALHESEERFHLFMNNSPTMAWIKDEQGKYVYLTKNFEESYGIKLKDRLGKTDAELWPPEIADEFRKNDLEVLKKDKPIQVAEKTINPDGTKSYWLNIKFPISDAAGNRFVAGIGLDITERKKAEEALRESEERFRTLLQDVKSVAVQGYGPDGTTQYWNKASEELYGYSAQEAIGKNLIDLIIPPEMREDVKSAIRQMAETGQPIPASELSLMRKDGSRVTVFSNHSIVKVPGQPLELFSIDIDLTEQKKAEDKILLHMEELRAANEDLEHFNRAMVGRELRMIELKKEINELMEKAGQPPRYKIDSEEEHL